MLNCSTCEWCHNKKTLLYVLCDCEVQAELRFCHLVITSRNQVTITGPLSKAHLATTGLIYSM
jgi:hypothetical protein